MESFVRFAPGSRCTNHTWGFVPASGSIIIWRWRREAHHQTFLEHSSRALTSAPALKARQKTLQLRSQIFPGKFLVLLWEFQLLNFNLLIFSSYKNSNALVPEMNEASFTSYLHSYKTILKQEHTCQFFVICTELWKLSPTMNCVLIKHGYFSELCALCNTLIIINLFALSETLHQLIIFTEPSSETIIMEPALQNEKEKG